MVSIAARCNAQGNEMSERSWFFGSQGQQQGPYSEIQLRELIAKGTVTADTLVWREGMVSWQKAGETPDLHSGTSGPPGFPASGGYSDGALQSGQPISLEIGTWALFGRALLYLIGYLFIIPLPWIATAIYRWLVAHLRIPRWTNPTFTGQPGDIWYVFIILALCTYAGLSGVRYIGLILLPIEIFLSWMIMRWFVANVSPDGQQRPLSFVGSIWGYGGWYVLMILACFTIIGWAWVVTAWMRWMCRNIAGTRRAVIFNASGWQVLWRTVVFSLVCSLIIPIPWMLAWYVRWYASQFALVGSTA
jgi:hypothetical protein